MGHVLPAPPGSGIPQIGHRATESSVGPPEAAEKPPIFKEGVELVKPEKCGVVCAAPARMDWPVEEIDEDLELEELEDFEELDDPPPLDSLRQVNANPMATITRMAARPMNPTISVSRMALGQS